METRSRSFNDDEDWLAHLRDVIARPDAPPGLGAPSELSTLEAAARGTAHASRLADAALALLETGTGTVGQTLGSDVIENLPINGRDYTILARLSTGVVPPQPGARAPLMFSANGVRPAQNNYMLDGIDNNTSNVDFLSGVAYIVKPPVDAVDEIKILTSSFSAEYGRAGGAVINALLVRPDLQRIFDYRRAQLAERFGEAPLA